MTTFIFGEAMLEYHASGGDGLRYGGDTLNTAIHMARAGHSVAYVTALGTDPISDALISEWDKEGIDTRFVLRHPTRTPGIYAIHLDEQGERSFLYWRDRSAARVMFELDKMAEALIEAEAADLLYFSLVTLAISEGGGRDSILELAAKRRVLGSPVAYDSNFRPALWPSLAEARDVSRRAAENCSIGLPTNSDERDLWQTDEDELDIASRWAGDDRIVVVKAGEKGSFLMEGIQPVAQWFPPERVNVVDSSGAGDAFNAGFLSAILGGKPTQLCVENGQSLARSVIGQFGAIPKG